MDRETNEDRGSSGWSGDTSVTEVKGNRAAAASKGAELYVEFDGRHVTIRSMDSEATEYVAAVYAHMLSDSSSEAIGVLEIIPQGSGNVLRGADSEYPPVEDMQILLHLVKTEVITLFMKDRRDLLWVHAGAVERGNVALVLPGRSGQGKSTLSTLLCSFGWRLMSDDAAPLRIDTDEVLPYPQSPLKRLYPGMRVPVEEIGELEREMVAIEATSLRRIPAPVGAIVFPDFVDGSKATLERVRQGDAALELLRHSSNLVDQREVGVDKVAGMARRLPFYRLAYGHADEAASLLNYLNLTTTGALR